MCRHFQCKLQVVGCLAGYYSVVVTANTKVCHVQTESIYSLSHLALNAKKKVEIAISNEHLGKR